MDVVGGDLSLPVLVIHMIGSEEAWKAAVSFAEEVMLLQETTERICRQEVAAAEATLAAAAQSSEEKEEGETEEEDDQSSPPSPPRTRMRTRGIGRGNQPPQTAR